MNFSKSLSVKAVFVVIVLLVSFAAAGCSRSSAGSGSGGSGVEITLYKSPNCGCCSGWASYMEDNGFRVKTIVVRDMNSVKAERNIPSSLSSCHTAEINVNGRKYFVEGHVPVEIVKKMVSEQPYIDGIALPRMPSGSPGMPGIKRETWTVYSLKADSYEEYEKV